MLLDVEKYGQWIYHNGKKYLLTNYRAVIFDKVKHNVDFTYRYNTSEEEIALIKKHFNAYRMKIDLPTRSQLVRHRQNYQELSRRYVSGERVPFEFYISEKMQKVYSEQQVHYFNITQFGEQELEFEQELSTEDIINICVNHYHQAIKNGVKPQEARRIIPQAAYTTIWVGMQSEGLESMLKLRTDEHTQWEFRQIALQLQEWQNEG